MNLRELKVYFKIFFDSILSFFIEFDYGLALFSFICNLHILFALNVGC